MNNYSDDVVERQGIPQYDRGESQRPRHVRTNPMRGRGIQRGWELVKNVCSSRSSKGVRLLAALVLICVALLLLWPSTHVPQPLLRSRSLKQDNRSAPLLGLALSEFTKDERGLDTRLSELATSAMHYAQLQRQLTQGFAVADFYFTERELATATTLLRKEALSVLINSAESTRMETIRGRKQQSDLFNTFGEDEGLMDVHQVRGFTPRQARRTPPSVLPQGKSEGTTLGTPLRACFIHFLELSEASTQSTDSDELSRLSPQVADLHRLSVNVRQHLPLMAARYPLIVFHNDLTLTDRLTDGESRMTPTGIALGEALLQLELRQQPNVASTARRLMSNAGGELPTEEVDPTSPATSTEQKEDEGPLLDHNNKVTTKAAVGGGTTRGSIPRNLMGDKRNARDMDALKRAHIRPGGASLERYVNATTLVFDKFGRRVPATPPPAPSQEEPLMDIKSLTSALLTRLQGRGKGVVLAMLRRFVFPRSISSPYIVPTEILKDGVGRSSVFTQMEAANDGGPHFPETFRYQGGTHKPSGFEHHIVPGMYFEPLESPAAAMRSVARKAKQEASGQQGRSNPRHLGDTSGNRDDMGSPQASSQTKSLIYTNRSDSFDYSQKELPSFIVPESRTRWPAPSTPGNGLQFRQRSRFLAIRLMYSRFFRDGEFMTGGSNTYTHRLYARQFDYFFRLDPNVFLLGTPVVTSLQSPQFTVVSNPKQHGRPLVATISEQDVFLTVAEKKAGYATSMVESASSHQFITGLWETYNAFVSNETALLSTRATRLGTKSPVGTILSDFSRAIARPEQLPHYVSGVEVVDLNRYRTVALSPRTVALLEMLIPFTSTSSAVESPLYSEGSRDLLRKQEVSRKEQEDNGPPTYPIANAGEVKHLGSLFSLDEAERLSPKSVLFPPFQWGGDDAKEEVLLAEQGGGDVDLPPSVERVLRALGGVISEDISYFEMGTRKKPVKKSAKESHESFMLRYFEKEIKLMKKMEKDNEEAEWVSKAPTDAESRKRQAKMVQRARVQRAVKEAARSEQEGRKANHRNEQLLLLGFYIPSAQEATETLEKRLLSDRVVDSAFLPDETTTVLPTPTDLISQLRAASEGSWLDLTDTDDGLATQLTKLFQAASDAIETGASSVGMQYVRLRADAQTKALRRVLTTSPDSLLVMLALYDYILLYLHLYHLPIHNKRALLVQEFLTRVVDQDAGGIYYNRWGDADIRTLANSLLLEPSEIVHMDTLPIQRGTQYHCPQSTLGGDQSRFSLTQQMSAAVHGVGGLWSFLTSTGESGVRIACPTSRFFTFFDDVTRNIGEGVSTSIEDRVKGMLGLTSLTTPKKVQEEWYNVFIQSTQRYVNSLVQGEPSCGSSLYRWHAGGGGGDMEGLGNALRSIASGAHASGAGMVSPLRRAVDILLQGKDGLHGDVRAALKAFELPPAMHDVVSLHEKHCIAAASKQEGGSGDPVGQESLLRSREASSPSKGRPVVPGLNAALPQPKLPGTVPCNPVDTPSLSSSLATIAAQLGGGWARV